MDVESIFKKKMFREIIFPEKSTRIIKPTKIACLALKAFDFAVFLIFTFLSLTAVIFLFS